MQATQTTPVFHPLPRASSHTGCRVAPGVANNSNIKSFCAHTYTITTHLNNLVMHRLVHKQQLTGINSLLPTQAHKYESLSPLSNHSHRCCRTTEGLINNISREEP